MMKGIHRHYEKVNVELQPTQEGITLPARIRSIVLASPTSSAAPVLHGRPHRGARRGSGQQ